MKGSRVTALVAVIGAVVAFVLLLPASGIDRNPPECYSAFGYVVPCAPGFAVAGALAAVVLVLGGSLAGRLDGRPRRTR